MKSKQLKGRKVSLKESVESLKKKFSTDKKLKKAEVPVPEKPTAHYKKFPENMADIPSPELGNYLGVYEAEASYIRHLVSSKEEEVALAEVLLDQILNDLMSRAPGERPNEIKNYAKTHPIFLEAKLEKVEIESELSRLKSAFEACNSYARAISREITNRRSDVQYTGRTNMILEDK